MTTGKNIYREGINAHTFKQTLEKETNEKLERRSLLVQWRIWCTLDEVEK